jgi:amino acid transporter
VTIFPVFSLKAVAIVAALALTGLNLLDVKQSATINNVLVITKIVIARAIIVLPPVGTGRAMPSLLEEEKTGPNSYPDR